MNFINLTDLIGKNIITPLSKRTIGNVIDVLVQPESGQVLGLTAMTNSGAKLKVLTKDLTVTERGVQLLNPNFVYSMWFKSDDSQGIEISQTIIGKPAVTLAGQNLGSVSEVLISRDFSEYQCCLVKNSRIHRAFDRKFVISGSACNFKMEKERLVETEQTELAISEANSLETNYWFDEPMRQQLFKHSINSLGLLVLMTSLIFAALYF